MSHPDERLSIGIDLGTTFSSIAFFDIQVNDCEMIKENNEKSSFPSFINIINSNGRKNILFGDRAKNQDGNGALYDSKRLIGKRYEEYQQMESETENWSFDVVEDSNGFAKMKINFQQNESLEFYPEDIFSLILTELVELLKKQTSTCCDLEIV